MSYYICRSVSINLSPSFAPYMHIVSMDIWQGGFYSKHTQMICGQDYGISLNCSPVVLWFEAPHQQTHGVGLEGKRPVHFYGLTSAKNTDQAFILQIKDIAVLSLFSCPDFFINRSGF